jgi:hypothetical protein
MVAADPSILAIFPPPPLLESGGCFPYHHTDITHVEINGVDQVDSMLYLLDEDDDKAVALNGNRSPQRDDPCQVDRRGVNRPAAYRSCH